MMRYYKHVLKKECQKVHGKYMKSAPRKRQKSQGTTKAGKPRTAPSLTNNPINQQNQLETKCHHLCKSLPPKKD